MWAGLPDHRPPWLIKWFLYENELRAFWTVVKKTILSSDITVQAWERASTSSVGKYKCFDRVPHRIPQQRRDISTHEETGTSVELTWCEKSLDLLEAPPRLSSENGNRGCQRNGETEPKAMCPSSGKKKRLKQGSAAPTCVSERAHSNQEYKDRHTGKREKDCPAIRNLGWTANRTTTAVHPVVNQSFTWRLSSNVGSICPKNCSALVTDSQRNAEENGIAPIPLFTLMLLAFCLAEEIWRRGIIITTK